MQRKFAGDYIREVIPDLKCSLRQWLGGGTNDNGITIFINEHVKNVIQMSSDYNGNVVLCASLCNENWRKAY